MKKLLKILFFSMLVACGKQESSPIIGSWSQCLRDGVYKEFKISKHYTTTSVSNFQEHDYDDGISFYKCHIQDSLLIITTGINVDLMNEPETLRFESISYDKITIENQFGISELTRLKDEIPEIDSTNLKHWRKLYLDKFLERAKLANCPDLRTEEEKNPPIELVVIADDFEEILDIEEPLPKWADQKYRVYKERYYRFYQVKPTFLEADFGGDKRLDIAIFAKDSLTKKDGIIFLFQDKRTQLIGFGISPVNVQEDFNWADNWKIFNKRITHETTFMENGDVDGTREILLERAGISIREDEGSGGLIYFNGENFVWIHQGD